MEFDTAVGIVRSLAPVMRTESVAIAQAHGRIAASDVASPINLPPFDNSAMDGFALPSAASEGDEFDVNLWQAAGDADPESHTGAAEIMTGAKMPQHALAVIPVERIAVLGTGADGKPSRIRVNQDVPVGNNIRRAGEDVAKDETILSKGTLLLAPHVMQLAGVGLTHIEVAVRPRVRIINTGAELVTDGVELDGSKIHNSNGPYLVQRVVDAGGVVSAHHVVSDDVGAFEQAMQGDEDLVISTGAVSMGRFDFIPQYLKDHGATIHFHKVSQRPGKPILFATLADGRHFFGLPGNPVSVAVGFRFYVEAMLRAMLGLAPERPLRLPVVNEFNKKVAMQQLLKARVELTADALGVRILAGQESFKVQPMLSANAWASIAPDVTGAVHEVMVVPSSHLFPMSILAS